MPFTNGSLGGSKGDGMTVMLRLRKTLEITLQVGRAPVKFHLSDDSMLYVFYRDLS